MKITRIETFQIETPRYYGHVSGHVIVKVHVDAGPVGLGEASDSRAADLGAIARRYNELLVGRDPTRITEINEMLRAQSFGSTVSDAHLASAIDLVVQITRFSEDGSRKVTRVSEAFGLNDQNHYQLQDLYTTRMQGKRADGMLEISLEQTGNKPTFASEPLEAGMQDRIKHTASLWEN